MTESKKLSEKYPFVRMFLDSAEYYFVGGHMVQRKLTDKVLYEMKRRYIFQKMYRLYYLNQKVSQIHIKQALCGTVPEQGAMTPFGDAQLQVPFGILFVQIDFIPCGKGHKRNVVVLFHGMV